MNDGLSFVRRMCASFVHDEARRLTCQVVRLDWFVVVGYACFSAADVCAGPRALSSAAAPCGGAAPPLSWGLSWLVVQAVTSWSEGWAGS